MTGIDLTEPERVTALGLTDSGRVAVGTSLGAIRVFDVDLATPRGSASAPHASDRHLDALRDTEKR